eukprot:COSAG01_NODE_55486_length_324_cov_3.995556_1_plen_33_part_10
MLSKLATAIGRRPAALAPHARSASTITSIKGRE